MSEEKSGLLHKLAKPFKSQSHDSSDSKTSKLSAHEEEIVHKAYLEGKKKAEKESHSKTSNVSGTTVGDYQDRSVIQQSYDEGHSKGKNSSGKNSAVDQAYYEGKSQGYADNTTSSDPSVVASTSVGNVLSTPPKINRKPVERETGDFANQKNPTDVVNSSSTDPEASVPGVAYNTSTTKSTAQNSTSIEKNSNPIYTDESEVKEGTGYYFNPKDTQGGIYNNKDASDYSEATRQSLPVHRNLKTEPTGSSDPQIGSKSNPSTQTYSDKKSSDDKSYGKEAAAAGVGAGAAIVGAEKYSQNKNSTPSDNKNTDYDNEIAKLDRQIDSTQKDIDALSSGKYANGADDASINAVYNEPLTSRNKTPTQDKYSSGDNSHTGATYLGRVGGTDHIVPPNTNSSLDPKLASTQPTPTPVGHGVSSKSDHATSRSEQPSASGGAKGAVAGVGAAAASAVGYNAYKSHSDSTKSDSNKDVLDQSYKAGQQNAKHDTSRNIASTDATKPGSHDVSSKSAHTTSNTQQPGAFDGAKGAVAGVGAAAASAVGYDAYKSHSDSTKTNSNKDVLDQSYDAGQHSANKDTSRYAGSTDGVIGSGAEVYGSSNVGNTSSSSGSHPTTGNIEKPHLDNIDDSSSQSAGYLAGVTGVLGSAAAAIGLGASSDSANHDTAITKDNAAAGTSKRDTPIVQTNTESGTTSSGLGSALGLGSASSKVAEPTSDTTGEVNSSNKGTAVGGISAALGGAAAAVGVTSSTKGNSKAQSSNEDSLVEAAARKYPDVDEQPAFTSKKGTANIKENIESKPSDVPSESNAKNSRDLESEVIAHNKKVGVKNDDRSLLQIAQDHSADVRNEPAFKGKGSVLDSDNTEDAAAVGGDVQEVPQEVFQNQNEFIRTGGKYGNLHDDPSSSAASKNSSNRSAVEGTTSGYSHHETKPLPTDKESSHELEKEHSSSGSDKSKSGGILGTGLLGAVFGSKSSSKHDTSDEARRSSGLDNSKSSSSSKLSEKESQEYYLEGVKRGSYEAGQVQATEDYTKGNSSVSGTSKSSTGSKVAGAAAAAGVIGGAGAAAHRENSNLANTSSGTTSTSKSKGANQKSNDDNLTVEVIGVEDRAKASEIAHQASKELVRQGVDLSSGKLVVDTNNKEIYKTSATSAGETKSSKSVSNSDKTQVPPVGLDKGIGNKYHSEHEAAKAKLENAAQHGDLGNVGEPTGSHGTSHGTHGTSHGASAAGGALAGSAVAGGAAAGRSVSGNSASQKASPSEILVTVKGTKDPSEATTIANQAVETLSDRPEVLANAKELKIDTDSGIVTNEAGKKLLSTKEISTSSSSANDASYGYERQGLEHTESSDSIPRTVPSGTDSASSAVGGPIAADSTITPANAKYSTSTQSEQSVHMPGAFVP
ncbi:hypothetical protein CLIB1423_02S07338 [[Candida] railenensis]|uniref:Uncharacterized protein n=1 Tax=[Candida] railenensis TaxID=45579 RepID=A0A9P0QM20_9ASCO|nr:hypothetical protein CLIB1423_02S07338 [[Candida] railenensis]